MSIKMKTLFFYIIIMAGLLTSCQKAEEVVPATVPSNADENILLNNNADELTARITYSNEPLKLTGLKTGLNLSLIGSAASPVVNGVLLSASYVLKRGNNVYVTYNERGNGYGGALVVFNVSNASQPVIVSEMTFGKTDINACDISGNGTALYLAGSSKSKGAVLLRLYINSAGIVTTLPADVVIKKIGSAASANGIIQGSSWLFVSIGNSQGGLYMLGMTSLAVLDYDPYNGAKFSTANGRNRGDNHMSLEAAETTAYLHVYVIGVNDTQVEKVFDAGPVQTQNVEPELTNFGKASIFIRPGQQTCFIARGKYGMKALNITNGNTVYESPSNMISDGNTNGVAADAQYVYMANGAQGLAIAQYPASGTTLDVAGVWDDPAHPGSANMVYSDANLIFVAKGKEGGLKIILKN
jgi:hypothetical protein